MGKQKLMKVSYYDPKDVLKVGITGNCAVFTKENFLFSARLVPGEYIDVDRIITC